MKKKMYRVSVVSKLLDTTYEGFKNQIGEQKESNEYVWASSKEDAVGQSMAICMHHNPENINISGNRLVYSFRFTLLPPNKLMAVNRVEYIFAATPI